MEMDAIEDVEIDIDKYDDIVYHLSINIRGFMNEMNLLFTMINHVFYESITWLLVLIDGVYKVISSLFHVCMLFYYLSKIVKVLDRILTNALMVLCFTFLLIRITVIQKFHYFCKRVNKYI